MSRGGTPTTASSGPSRLACLGTVDVGRASARDALGRWPDASLVSATLGTVPQSGQSLRTSGSCASGSGCARRGESPSARPSTSNQALSRARTCPTRAPRAPSSASPRRSRALPALAGRALVLTNSYRASAAIAPRLRGRSRHVLVQGEAPRERLLERFRDEVDSVLVATATFWQGVDVPGESLSLLVIDKLPFAAPGRPARRGAVRADRGRRRRLVPRVLAARGGAAAAAGVRPADPLARRPRRRRHPRPAGAHEAPTAARSSRRCRRARSTATAPRSPSSSRRGPAERLIPWAAVAKKPRTPPPPRKVQAPKQRHDPTGQRPRRARRRSSTVSRAPGSSA